MEHDYYEYLQRAWEMLTNEQKNILVQITKITPQKSTSDELRGLGTYYGGFISEDEIIGDKIIPDEEPKTVRFYAKEGEPVLSVDVSDEQIGDKKMFTLQEMIDCWNWSAGGIYSKKRYFKTKYGIELTKEQIENY